MSTHRISAPQTVRSTPHGLRGWLLMEHPARMQGAYQREHQQFQTRPWWQVMCLTGVDYFSTLGYQPGIAVLAAGALSPLATLVLVLLTLFGALPIYSIVAKRSPRGEGSIAMLEHLLAWWKGKLFVLALLGFAATDFIIMMTLSAADATAHIIENPYTPASTADHRVGITLFLLAGLCAVFLRGFKAAIEVAVALVGAYLLLNLIVVLVGLQHVLANPDVLSDWKDTLVAEHGNPFMMIAVAVIVFPKLALGLSGFETGVTMMPLVRGTNEDKPHHPQGRIHNTRRLLTAAALIMSFFLITSSFVTTLLISKEHFETGGEANGRALAYLAHQYLGNGFGTVYDISTILILWFAGASAMAGLLNIVPRFLPRYGMAPDWARAARPLVLVLTAIAFAVTIWFGADVDAQGGAYATGVLVLITSAAIAVTLSKIRLKATRLAWFFGGIAAIFACTTIVNIVERPDGVKIASFFIAAIIVTSLLSRIFRSTELRAAQIVVDDSAQAVIDDFGDGPLRIIANHPDERNTHEYQMKEREQRQVSKIPADDPVLFLEVTVRDASEFAPVITVHGATVGNYRVLLVEAASIPNAIAAVLLYLRDRTGRLPHAYFGWTEGTPLKYLARFFFFGSGDIAPITHEILRKAEPDRSRRPIVHVG